MVRKFHTATVPRHKSSTMKFLSKSFGLKVKSAGASRSTATKSGTISRTTPGRKNP